MSNISEKRLAEIMLFNADHGDTTTCIHYELNSESLNRYKRLYNAGNKNKTVPRVLLLDIETAPMELLSWTLFKPILNHGNVLKDWFMLSWAAKWLFSAEMMSDVVTPKEALKRDDRRISESIWKLMDEADIIIGHNVRRFDIKRLNTRFILNGLKPPMPYQTVDTLIEARKHFAFPSNRLDYLGQMIVRRNKIETDFNLWKRCLKGEQAALDYMVKYDEGDTFLLEDVYVELRPWIRSHPNMSLFVEGDGSSCGHCMSTDLLWENKYYTTMVSKFAAYRCKNCGAPNRCRTSALSKEQRKNLLVSTAR